LAVQELMEPLAFSGHSLDAQTAQDVALGLRGQVPFIRLLRPEPQVFEAELPQVLAYADLRVERSTEILSQIDGQWAHWCSILPMRPDSTPHTLALLTTALQWVIPVELRFKHALGCPRPMAWSPQVQPCITTPGHGSFPMGHAVQAFLTAGLLQTLTGAQADDAWGVQLTRTAFRMAINRVVAGVHFPVDLVAGLVLGLSLTRYLHRMAHTAARRAQLPRVVFDPVRYQSLGPLGGLHSGVDVMRAFQVAQSDEPSNHSPSVVEPQAPAWAELWRAAAQEWQEVHHGA
jgi:membrane-associated phospholipid phosphatase